MYFEASESVCICFSVEILVLIVRYVSISLNTTGVVQNLVLRIPEVGWLKVNDIYFIEVVQSQLVRLL